MLKLSKAINEVCYPFIQEQSCLCDYEVLTDELCALIGAVISCMPDEMHDLQQDLKQLQPLAFHLNGSIRGRLAVTEEDVVWLDQRLNHYQVEVAERLKGFVLPRGSTPIPQLHQVRSVAKKAIRSLVRIDQEGIEVPLLLPRLLNMICNFSFILTLVINQRRGLDEIPFTSKSYGPMS